MTPIGWLRCTPLLLAGAYALGVDLSDAPLPFHGEGEPAMTWRHEAPFSWVLEPPEHGYAGLVGMTDGDLDGDGRSETVAILGWNTGGSGHFSELVAYSEEAGKAVFRASAPIGDRCPPHRLEVDGGVISLLLTVHGRTEPMCCPTRVESRGWRLANDRQLLVPCWHYLIVEGFDGLVPDMPAWWIRPPLR